MASAAHREIAEEGDPVGREIDEQNAAQADVVIDESDDRAGNQPASLDAGQQKSVGIDEFFPGSQLLDEGGDGRPEHPETRRHQHVHQVEFPDFHFAGIGQQGHDHDDQGARGIEDHDQAAAIFAVDEDAGEGEHQHGGDRLQNGEGAEGDFGVRGLQNVPGDGGRVHAAAQHGDQIGAEDETQRPLLQNGTHTLLLYEKCAPVECASRVFASGFDRGEWAAAQGETSTALSGVCRKPPPAPGSVNEVMAPASKVGLRAAWIGVGFTVRIVGGGLA